MYTVLIFAVHLGEGVMPLSKVMAQISSQVMTIAVSDFEYFLIFGKINNYPDRKQLLAYFSSSAWAPSKKLY